MGNSIYIAQTSNKSLVRAVDPMSSASVSAAAIGDNCIALTLNTILQATP